MAQLLFTYSYVPPDDVQISAYQWQRFPHRSFDLCLTTVATFPPPMFRLMLTCGYVPLTTDVLPYAYLWLRSPRRCSDSCLPAATFLPPMFRLLRTRGYVPPADDNLSAWRGVCDPVAALLPVDQPDLDALQRRPYSTCHKTST